MGVGSRVGRATREGAGSGDGAWPLSVFRQPAEVVLMSSAARLELETLNSETRRDADAIRARLQGEWSTFCFLSPPPLQQQEVSHPASSLSRSPAEAPPSGPGRGHSAAANPQ